MRLGGRGGEFSVRRRTPAGALSGVPAFSQRTPPKMTVKLSSLRADTAREEAGDWITIPDLPGVRLKVRSLQSVSYVSARDVLIQRLARTYRGKPTPQDVQTREFGKLYADHILLDWEGFDEPYSIERARDLLTDPEWRRLVGHIEWAAGTLAEMESESLETAAKNSAAPSAST